MRVRVTEPTRIKVAPQQYADLDAHHEYYLDDDQAQSLVSKGVAVELDARGRDVQRKTSKPAAKTASTEQAPAPHEPEGGDGKPGAARATKAVKPPANKTASAEKE